MIIKVRSPTVRNVVRTHRVAFVRLYDSINLVLNCGKNMLDVYRDPRGCNEYIAMVKTGSECHLTDYMSSRGKNCYGSLLRESVVPTKFLLVLLNTLPVGCGMGWERSTLRITGRDTAQTERILMRLVDTSSLDSRLHHSGKRVFARHPCIELCLLSCCLCQRCTHDSSFFQSPYFAHQHEIHIKYVDTKNQFADILTNGNDTREEWNHFLRLFNIMNFSQVCINPFQLNQLFSDHVEKDDTARKPGENERAVAKSKPMRNLVSNTVDRSPTSLGSSASLQPGILTAKSSNLDLIDYEETCSERFE